MQFEYRVRDQQGRLIKGVLEAEDKSLVIESLMGQGYYITELKEVRKGGGDLNETFSRYSFKKVNTRDLVILTRQLSTMLAAGLSILRCFKILGEQTTNKRLKMAVLEIRADIEAGLALWEAIAKHPKIFSNIFISMIRAGELGGVLEAVLDRLAQHLEREQEINSKVKSASIYPTMISIFAVIAVFGIITMIMPMFTEMFESSGVALPAPTRFLIGLSNVLKNYFPYIAVAIVLIVFMVKQWAKTSIGKYFFDNMYLHLPVIGTTVSRIAVARFARTMGTLVRSGIPVLQALEVVEEVVGNTVISGALSKARSNIKEGETITQPLVDTGVFEPMVTQMIAVGEETGSLDEMLMRMSDYYERELMYTIDAMMSIIEPLLIITVALMVGGVVVATLMPMFDMMKLVGG